MLVQLIGTTYGGDGEPSFALPDLMDRSVIGPNQGAGLSDYSIGEEVGTGATTLLTSEMPVHSHTARASSDPAELSSPAANRVLARSSPGFAYRSGAGQPLATTDPGTAASVGGDLPHNNTQPVLALSFCIALQGVFPPRG